MTANVQKHGLEQTAFVLTATAAALTWLVLISAEGGIALAIVLVFTAWIAQEMLLAQATLHSVAVGPHQMPKIWSAYVTVGSRLGIPNLPPLYLRQSGGVLNAYAARLARRMQVVLESGLVEALDHDPEALEFVIAHELGHHLAKHTTLLRHLFIAPVTIFGLVLFQLGLNRGQELTADRYRLHGSRDLQAAERALMVLLGGRLAATADANAIEAQWQSSGMVGRLVEFAATHPNCPRRIAQLRYYARAMRLDNSVGNAA
jgi:Zn-dependent protease with chaperone function